jgi:hypothetical protein
MTRINLDLYPKTEIAETIVRWDFPKLLQNPALIEITGTAVVDSTIPEGPQKHLAERALTIRIDVNAAVQLSRQILGLVG